MARAFWHDASINLKMELCKRANVSHMNVNVLEFALLPNELKATIYESEEFRNS